MKQCTTCGEHKDESEFNKKSSNKGGLERYCKVCHKARNKKHYESNPAPYVVRATKRRRDLQEWWTSYKSNLSCSVCSESRHWCLDFHHTDPSQKEGSLAQMVRYNSREAVEKELEKCIVVCRNCHADIHYQERISR